MQHKPVAEAITLEDAGMVEARLNELMCFFVSRGQLEAFQEAFSRVHASKGLVWENCIATDEHRCHCGASVYVRLYCLRS